MKLQPGICPFPALVLGLWGKNYHATRRYHGISPGFPRPLSVSKVPSEEQRNIGFSFILSVVLIIFAGRPRRRGGGRLQGRGRLRITADRSDYRILDPELTPSHTVDRALTPLLCVLGC